MQLIVVLRLLRPFVHSILLLGVFAVAYFLRQVTDLIPGIQLRIPVIDYYETLIYALISVLFFLVIASFSGLYYLYRPVSAYAQKFFTTWLIWFAVITSIAYYGDAFFFISGISRFIIVRGSLFGLLTLSVADVIMGSIIRRVLIRNPARLLLVYHERKDSTVQKEFNQEKTWLCESISFIELQEKKHLKYFLSSYDGVAMVGTYPRGAFQNIADLVTISGKSFFHLPESFFLEDTFCQPVRFGDLTLFEFKPSPLDGWLRVLKRLFDIIFSFIFIIVFSRLYLLISFCILLFDGWPVFYISRRVGKNGKTFSLVKFRTMVVNAESLKKTLKEKNEREGPLFKLTHDPRVTWFGKILRKISLDEIPQFFNILVGSMSVVGPRPHLPQEISLYQPRQKRLLRIKPGITGYAQIFGRDNLSFDREAKLDLDYTQNRSPWFDIVIIIKTVNVILHGK